MNDEAWAAAARATLEKARRGIIRAKTGTGWVRGRVSSTGDFTLLRVAIDGDDGAESPVMVVGNPPPVGMRVTVLFSPPAGALAFGISEGGGDG